VKKGQAIALDARIVPGDPLRLADTVKLIEEMLAKISVTRQSQEALEKIKEVARAAA